ncbi:glycosyltransferase, partial [Streptomyces tubercidicus]
IAETLRRREAALVTDGSPEQLADAVLRLLEDRPLRERVTRAGRAAIEAEFSLTAVTDRLEGWYGSLARPGAG